jgi:NAD(P) transhydrogenase subunit alpha
MSTILQLITVFVLAAFLGYEVISKVPSILHTPLMSGTNAIHGIILAGAIIILGTAHSTGQIALGFATVVLATLNVVGGFVVTDRMLEMFKSKNRPARASDLASSAGGNEHAHGSGLGGAASAASADTSDGGQPK